mmetsp:Transcript_129652/g.414787  ORF Transcript_129652/g.414787 Transcript_129652/m.414787 type:complete len:213 (+) Transcript_129652:1005-1643(+)
MERAICSKAATSPAAATRASSKARPGCRCANSATSAAPCCSTLDAVCARLSSTALTLTSDAGPHPESTSKEPQPQERAARQSSTQLPAVRLMGSGSVVPEEKLLGPGSIKTGDISSRAPSSRSVANRCSSSDQSSTSAGRGCEPKCVPSRQAASSKDPHKAVNVPKVNCGMPGTPLTTPIGSAVLLSNLSNSNKECAARDAMIGRMTWPMEM